MPMIDIYAVAGTFADPKQLAIDAATTVKTIEGVPDVGALNRSERGGLGSLGSRPY